MHLIDENTPRLYLAHWMGNFEQKQNKSTATSVARRTSQLDIGVKEYGGESYVLSNRTWAQIGSEISASHKMFPSQFGKALRDISKYHGSYKATELMNFMHIISPIVLNGRLPEDEYTHWHHLALSTERSRQYKLNPHEIEDMERDMIRAVTEYERLYYRYDRARLSSCTTQVHGLLHISAAMRLCEPTTIYHQYPMEKMCGFIKSMIHSRSSPNRNISLGILEAERIRFLSYIARVPEQRAECDYTEGRLLFDLEPDEKIELEQYPNCLLMRPKRVRKFNQYERGHLHRFYMENHTYEDVQQFLSANVLFTTWGRAVAGIAFNNQYGHEVTGSLITNGRNGDRASGLSRRDDSHVRYTINEQRHGNSDISYFGRVLFYMHHQIPGQSTLLLAYIQRHKIGRIRKRKLAYKIKDSQREFVELSNIQELIGFVESRERLFYVSKTSCFWPKKQFSWDQIIDNSDFIPEIDDV